MFSDIYNKKDLNIIIYINFKFYSCIGRWYGRKIMFNEDDLYCFFFVFIYGFIKVFFLGELFNLFFFINVVCMVEMVWCIIYRIVFVLYN